jgi:dinuclear metal center YbgI/SA1388 family protein
MTFQRDQILHALDELLKPEQYRDHCPNGLQVHGCASVTRLATCASVSEEFFVQAREAGAQFLLVHHGLFWEGTSRVIDPLLARRLRLLLDAELSLAAYHLPLDAHPTFGNNARLAALLGLSGLAFDFGQYHGTSIGCLGCLPEPLPIEALAGRLGSALLAEPQLYAYGPPRVSRVGVVSGGAGDSATLLEALQRGCDLYVTGSMTEQGVALCREGRLNVIAAGHYNSEKLGVRAVGGALAEELGVEVLHLDVPNPV